MVHYYGDGKGRDFYMTINDGGQCNIQNWKEHVEVAFPASLRNYQQSWNLVTAFDYLKNNPKYANISREKARRQHLLSRQLSEPKF
jgi:predicted transcriptional regulator